MQEYDVVENSSGSSIRGKTRISKKGTRTCGRAMHFRRSCCHQYIPEMKALYERVFDRTKIKMKGAVAVQRKLLVLIYTLFKKGVAYDPDYHRKVQPAEDSIPINKAGHGVPAQPAWSKSKTCFD
ncbi:MAG: hypothetical protein R2788_12485 [Saprospiraceae bacterium]